MTSQPARPSQEDFVPSALIIRGSSLEGDDARDVSALVSAYLMQTEREKRELGVGDSSSPTHVLPTQYEREMREPRGAYADCAVLIAEVEKRPVGVVVVRIAEGEAEIKRLWADPAVRGRGVGSALLDAALALAPGPIRLSVWEWRSAALRLYESRGFVRVASWDAREGLVCMTRRGSGPSDTLPLLSLKSTSKDERGAITRAVSNPAPHTTGETR